MYRWLQPAMVIPTHGEAAHLKKHAEVAREVGVRRTLTGRNGDYFASRQFRASAAQRFTGRIPIAGNPRSVIAA